MPGVRIAHVSTVPITLRNFLLDQLKHLQGVGYEVAGISAEGPEVADITAGHVRHIAVPMTRRLNPLADLVSLWSLFWLLKRERFTIVHTHTPKACLFGQLAARLARVPIVVCTVHGLFFHENSSWLARRFYIFMEKLSASFSDLVFFINGEDAQVALRQRICQPAQVREVKGGVGIHVERFDGRNVTGEAVDRVRKELGLKADDEVVGFVGRLVAEKGIGELLEAARLVLQQRPKVRFLIIGPLDHAKSDCFSLDRVAGYGVGDSCIFTGMRQDLPVLYSLMDLLVLPSYREGFPVSVMEAAAAGVPCVVTNVRGCREAVQHERTGLVVPLGNVPALASAILELLSDKEKARRMGEEAKRFAADSFDQRKVFEVMEAEYAQLLRRQNLPLPSGEGDLVLSDAATAQRAD